MTDYTDLIIGSGDNPTITFTVTDGNGDAVNLTGASGTFGIYANFDASALFEIDVTVTDAANGVCTAALSGTHTATPGKYVTKLAVVTGAGKRGTVRLPRKLRIQR